MATFRPKTVLCRAAGHKPCLGRKCRALGWSVRGGVYSVASMTTHLFDSAMRPTRRPALAFTILFSNMLSFDHDHRQRPASLFTISFAPSDPFICSFHLYRISISHHMLTLVPAFSCLPVVWCFPPTTPEPRCPSPPFLSPPTAHSPVCSQFVHVTIFEWYFTHYYVLLYNHVISLASAQASSG
jgi:hypothetical protein